ncbi:MAG: hypothetical protein JW869_05200 [Candidatus Omnitrophica bacterium]|nr:hypothetical protein [Candidatus Omnitrophota bacterium]
MRAKKILLMHISNISGHRSASVAIENALRSLDQNTVVKSINGFNYTNPLAEKIINALYMIVIKNVPGLWDHLYDNENVLRKLRKARAIVHRIKERKIKKLFNTFQPDMVVCTQAFPCGMVADYKRRHRLSIPLMGVLTDFAPHSYWVDDFVDLYVVPAEKIKQSLCARGIPREKLQTLGIPIDVKFSKQTIPAQAFSKWNLKPDIPTILIMGGGQGLGPIKEIVATLNKIDQPLQLIVVCGTNKKLFKWLKKRQHMFKKRALILGYVREVDQLMDMSCLIITKPGGLTSAEALSKSLPIIIVSPLPGQESLNTQYLLETGAALKVNTPGELKPLVEDLLNDKDRLGGLQQKAWSLAYAGSALNIAKVIIETVKKEDFTFSDAILTI